MPLPDCDKCLLQNQLDKCCYYNCLEVGSGVDKPLQIALDAVGLPISPEELEHNTHVFYEQELTKKFLAVLLKQEYKPPQVYCWTCGCETKLLPKQDEPKAKRNKKQGIELW